jgi:hypothetical protein
LRYDYLDSLGKKIIPDKKYQYWHYATYSDRYGSDKIQYTILKEGGDITLSKKIDKKINPIKTIGIFQRGHPSYTCNYAVIIEDKKVNYIKTEDQFRTFLGNIDNLEEAILLARTYDYGLYNDKRGSEYRKTKKGYELHLMKYHEFPKFIEFVELQIGKDGTIKTKSLEISKIKY